MNSRGWSYGRIGVVSAVFVTVVAGCGGRSVREGNDGDGAAAASGAGGVAAGGANTSGTGGGAEGGSNAGMGGGAGSGAASGGNSGIGGSSSNCSDAWTLTDFAELESVGETESVLLGDIDGDERLELFALSGSTVFLFRQTDDGTLSRATSHSIRGLTGSLGDWDADGDFDLVAAAFYDVFWLPNDGQGGFLAADEVGESPDQNTPYERVLLEDADRDGFLDAVVVGVGIIDIHYGNGDGSVRSQETIDARTIVDDSALVDVNADGMLDIVVLESGGELVAYEQGGGAFSPEPRTMVPTLFADFGHSLSVGDIDGDGETDLVGSGRHESSQEIVLLPAREGFATYRRIQSYEVPNETRVADLDGNGEDDVVVIHAGWHRLGVYRQCGGQLQAERLFDIPYVSNSVRGGLAVGDLNGDRCGDVALDNNGDAGPIVLYGQNCSR